MVYNENLIFGIFLFIRECLIILYFNFLCFFNILVGVIRISFGYVLFFNINCVRKG